MYSFTRTRPPHQVFNVFFYPDAPSSSDSLCIKNVFCYPDAPAAPDSFCILMYFFLCILLPGRALRTRFLMYSYVGILMYSFARRRPWDQIFYVYVLLLFTPCILVFTLYSFVYLCLLCILCLSFIYVYLCIPLYTCVTPTRPPPYVFFFLDAASAPVFYYIFYVIILMYSFPRTRHPY